MMFASSHLMLITNRAVIGGTREFTSVVSNKWSSNCCAREFTSVVSD